MRAKGKRTAVLKIAGPPGAEDLAPAVAALREGGVVAFPTDTVYGLGCDASCPEAVDAVYRAKGRERGKPLVLFVAGAEEAFALAEGGGAARSLAGRFWPGPLTLVLRAKTTCPRSVVARDGSVAVRVPDHEIPRALAKALAKPLATTSANPSGAPEVTEPAQVFARFQGVIDVLLDGGRCREAVPSTVVEASGEGVRILRRGKIPKQALEQVVPEVKEERAFKVLFVCTGNSCRSPMAEGLLRERLAREGLAGVEVSSAGVAALDGGRAAENAIQAVKESGGDISRHRTRSLRTGMVRESDLVVVMEPRHQEEVLELCPEGEGKVFLLNELGDPPGHNGVTDPIGMPLEDYRAVRDEIAGALDGVLAKIREMQRP